MQLWQKTTGNFAIENLWQKTQADIKKMLQPDYLCSERFFPYQYSVILHDEALLSERDHGDLNWLTDRIFLHRITGGHIELKGLLKDFEFLSDTGKFMLWGHEIIGVLGSGSSSVVYRTRGNYALKVAHSTQKNKLLQEYLRLSGIKCDNIVKAFDFYESIDSAGILLEHLPSQFCNTEGFVCGLNCLHQTGLCHGDIRYANLGSDHNGTAKLFDLGNSFFGTTETMQKEKKDLRLLLEKINRIEQRNEE